MSGGDVRENGCKQGRDTRGLLCYCLKGERCLGTSL